MECLCDMRLCVFMRGNITLNDLQLLIASCSLACPELLELLIKCAGRTEELDQWLKLLVALV